MKKEWKTLRKTLNDEVKLARRAIKQSIKDEAYSDASDYDQQWQTVSWILKQMDSIEETGEAL